MHRQMGCLRMIGLRMRRSGEIGCVNGGGLGNLIVGDFGGLGDLVVGDLVVLGDHCLGGLEEFDWPVATPPSSLHVQDLLGLS